MPYYPDIEFCIKLADYIGYHPFKGYTLVQVLRYGISWALLTFPPILTIVKLSQDNEKKSVLKIIGVSLNITMYLHGLFRNSVLFFGRKEMKAVIEATKNFWDLENYDVIVRKTKRERQTYTFIIFLFILTGCVKRHLNVRATGLYFPPWAPKHLLVLIQDMASEWDLLTFIASDIFFRTLVIQMNMQLRMLNDRLLKVYDVDEDDEKMIQQKLKECVEHYVVLIR
ncbi:unnamed protein product, partial [Callosobruchus maculatus]